MDYLEDGCHKTHLEDEIRIHERFGSKVPTCCSVDGYVDIGTCYGTDRKVYTRIISQNSILILIRSRGRRSKSQT